MDRNIYNIPANSIFDDLLQELEKFVRKSMKGLMLPVNPYGRAEKALEREIAVFSPAMPEPEENAQKVPYILLTILNGADDEDGSSVNVRAVITTYNEDPVKGKVVLLHIIEKLRFDFMRAGIIGEKYRVQKPFEWLIYPDDTGMNHLGELSINLAIPTVELDIPGLHSKF